MSFYILSGQYIVTEKHGNLETFKFISVKTSSFINGIKAGNNGGGIMISSKDMAASVSFSHCLFSGNKAVMSNRENAVFGGAIYLSGTNANLQLLGSHFTDKVDNGLGTALYVSKGVSVKIINCDFNYTISVLTKDLISILLLDGDLVTENSTVNIANEVGSFPDLAKYVVEIVSADRVGQIDIDVQCPQWYRHNADYKKSEGIIGEDAKLLLSNLVYQCLSCSNGFYTVSEERKSFRFSSTRDVSIESSSCIECPYGAQCFGNTIIPRPNYWGYWHNDDLVFKQCPPFYCCTGSADSPCTTYDSCAPNRTGTLCGMCEQGLSVSILTGECIPDSECEQDYLFWLFAVPIALAYALWYTFKGDILAIALFPFLAVMKRFNNHSKENKVADKPTNQNDIHLNKVDNAQICNEEYGKPDKELSEPNYTSTGSHQPVQKNKGYFGIVTFYVQMSAAMKIEIEFSDIDDSKSVLEYITDNIDRVLNFALSDITVHFCPISDLSTRGKYISMLFFLIGVYITWCIIYLFLGMLSFIFHDVFHGSKGTKHQKSLDSVRLKFISGLVEIIKYTYEGFCEVIFLSLVCVKIKGVHVWWYDGSQVCLEEWQTGMLIFGVVYAIPFPIALFLSMKLLEQGKISATSFFLCCLCPLLGLIIICFGYNDMKDSEISDSSAAILFMLQRPFRKDPKHMTLYWEAMISVRRLLITGMTLLRGYGSIRMTILCCLCIAFLIQHIYQAPFKVRTSNYIETLSLTFLSLFAIFNLMKALLTDNYVIPDGPSVVVFKVLEVIERLFPIILIAVIVAIEIKRKLKNKPQKQQ